VSDVVSSVSPDTATYDGPVSESPATGEPALRRLRAVSVGLLIAFCVAVAVITFWPGPPDPDGQRALKVFLLRAHMNGLPLWITFGKIEFGANIVMFLPIGFFGALALPRFRWIVVPAALSASVAIEAVQAARMPERVGTPRDVVANLLGAVGGYLLALLVLGIIRRRNRRKTAVTAAAPSH
jgi:glycopeptide antibiotics resistance protein